MMKESARKVRAKSTRLLRLYSLWHETHQDELQKKCVRLLGEVLAIDPSFNLRHEFNIAF